MPPVGLADGSPGTPSPFVGLTGPIIPQFFGVDELSLVFLIALAALAALLILCLPATGDFARHLIILLFFFVGAVGVVTAQNVAAFYAGWEATCLFAWGIGQLAGDSEVRNARVIPFQVVGALGSLAMLLGLGLLEVKRGTMSFGGGPADAGVEQLGPAPFLLLLAIVLKTFGLLAEGWNLAPDRRRFNLAGATLAGAGVLAVGVYPLFRLFGPVLAQAEGWREPVFWTGVGIAVVASLAAFGEADYRRALSYGAFSQVGLLTAVYTVGTPAATQGAVFGAIANAFAFTGLFLSVGAAEEATSQVVLSRIGGLAQRLPLTSALFVIASLSVIGVPPFAGAVAARLIGVAAETTTDLPIIWEAIAGLTALYLARLFVSIFLGEPRGPIQPERRWPSLVFGGSILGALALLAAASTDLLTLLAPLANVRAG